MTLRLILMRHAKSSWGDPGQDDHDRPLNKRGCASADALGDWLRAQGHVPDQILCSSAARTRETCERLRLDAPVTHLASLYLAAPQQMFAALGQATGKTVLMIGHNPGIATLAARIIDRPPAHLRFFDYPTGATLVTRFDAASWDTITNGRVVDFTVPHDLLDIA